MEYTISRNDAFKSVEVTFEGKPSEAVREALKALKFRWHSVKKLWYGYATEAETRAAIEATSEEGDISREYYEKASEGYMGATELTGNLYAQGVHLYGSELSKAIREAFKANGIKGVSVSSKTFAGGQEINVTMKVDPSDIPTLEKFAQDFDVWHLTWLTGVNGEQIHRDSLPWNDPETMQKIRQKTAEAQYTWLLKELNDQYGLDLHNAPDGFFSRVFMDKVAKAKRIMGAFNHDDSNGQVDYFDTHFYEWIKVKLDK